MWETNARRIVIGDVHGHFDALMTLIEAVSPSQADQIYFLGDLIDRGPQSAQVVEFVKGSYTCLLGNHEQMLIDAFPMGKAYLPALQAWLYNGGQDTIDSYEAIETSLFEHLNWMQTLPTYLDLGDVWLVHAGVHPGLPIEAQTAHEFCWIRSEFHSMHKPYFTDKLIVTGHTITFTLPNVQPGRIAQGHGWLDIDTGAYHPKSGWMTALDITHKVVYQVNVFEGSVRKLPLTEAVTWVSPDLITSNR